MMDSAPLTDPVAILQGLAAIVGLLAARSWLKVFHSVDTSGQAVTGPNKRDLQESALLSAITIGLASAGYLLGVALPLF